MGNAQFHDINYGMNYEVMINIVIVIIHNNI